MRQETKTVAQGPATTGLVRPVLVATVLFLGITGLVYPLVTTVAANLMFAGQAQGDLVMKDGAAVGSRIIGQWFAKPEYFHPRPSVTTGADPKDASKAIDQPYNAASSAASNLAPTAKKLIDAVTARVADYRKENGLGPNDPVPADAATASASGLDPDISVENARLQVKRVATARGLQEQQVLTLINSRTQGPQFGLLGPTRVNVLELNLALDKAARVASK
jgi:K+-transporting ATPase ATPase C chain